MLLNESSLNFFLKFCISIIKCGRIPQHVAFIMDGNRRYARNYHTQYIVGHRKGYESMSKVLQFSLELGIPEVTVYVFSIENFKRSEEEVNSLMDLLREKMREVLRNIDQMNEKGVRFNAAGRLTLLPKDLQILFSKTMLATKNNTRIQINFACAYTARDEISRTVSSIIDGVRNNELSPDDITEELVSRSVELGQPDLLIRTSGEVRLSDFMLWQVSNTILYFSKTLWPEFGILDILGALIHFQRHTCSFLPIKQIKPSQELFLRILEGKRRHTIENTASDCLVSEINYKLINCNALFEIGINK